MAFTLDSTVAGASANAYASAASATDYFDGRLDASEWSSATTTAQESALAMATQRLDAEEYVGVATTSTQALKFPRHYVLQPNGLEYEATGVIPGRVLHATYELALWLLKDNTRFNDHGMEAFEAVTVGPLSVRPRHDYRAGTLPAHVQRLLREIRIGGSQVPVVRG